MVILNRLYWNIDIKQQTQYDLYSIFSVGIHARGTLHVVRYSAFGFKNVACTLIDMRYVKTGYS